MKKLYLLFILQLLLSPILMATEINEELEAESASVTGDTEVLTSENASDGSFLRLNSADPNGEMQVTITNVPSAGTYKLELYTFNGNSSVSFDLKINNEATTSQQSAPSNWAYEGSSNPTLLDVDLNAGTNTITITSQSSAFLIDKLILKENYNIYYFSADGSDANDGSLNAPFQTLAKATAVAERANKGGILQPGDKMLFRRGDTFEGQFNIFTSGTANAPIEIGSYGDGELPILSGSGNLPDGDYIETIKMTNVSHILMNNLWIKNDRQNKGNFTWGTNTSYGIKVIANKWGGVSKNLTFRNLKVTDIYAIDMIDWEGKFTLDYYNAKGIFFDADKDDITVTPTLEIGIDDVTIEDCYFYNLGSTAISVRHLSNIVNNPIDEEERNLNYIIRNNHFEKLGGDGVVLSSVCNAIVEKNTFIDLGQGEKNNQNDLLYGRGEGCWIWNTRNVVVQFNKQYRARGFGDTYASGHVDFYCNNSIFQYNYSEDTEGGFVEILGECENTTFRYNVSKNDGFRDHHGYTIWVSGYVGTDKTPVRSNNNYVYNNTILLDKAGYKPDFSIFAKNTYIYNNVFKVAGGAQMGAEEVMIDIANGSELIVDNNLFYGDVANAFKNLDNNKITGQDPLFLNESATDENGFKVQEGSPVVNAGRTFPEPSFPMAGQGIFKNFSLHTATDFYGNPVDINNLIPNIGADNSFSLQLPNDAIRVVGISLSSTGESLMMDETVQLTATVSPSNAYNTDIFWSSSDETVATVDANGLVTALADGVTTIKATSVDGNFSASAIVSVGVVEEINLVINGSFEDGLVSPWNSWNNPQETSDSYEGDIAMAITTKGSVNQWINVEQNTDYVLSAYIKISNTSDRVVLGINDENNDAIGRKDIYTGVYKYHEVEFNSGNNSTVKVFTWLPPNNGSTATVDNMKVIKKSTVPVAVTGVDLSAQSGTLLVGETITLAEDILPNNATNKNVTWSSDNSAVATVFNGVVTGEGVGTANITVRTEDGNFTASTTVTVSPSSIAAFKNGDFEDDLNHWNTWQNVSTTTSSAYQGKTMVLDGVASCNQTVTVEPSTSYVFTGYAKVDNPTSERVVMGVNDENKIGMAFQNITNTSYTYHEVFFETDNDQTEVTVYFWRPSGGTGNAYMDNAMLYEVAASSSRKLTNLDLQNELAELLVYPNPSSDQINIKMKNSEGVKSLQVFDIVGQSVLTTSFENKVKVSVSDFSKGTYFIIVTDNNGLRIPSKFIVK